MSHIRVKNLSVWYGRQKALNNITIDIPDKKITAIIGPSGCGKTTLLKSFNRLIDLQEKVKITGEVLVDGENIYDPNVEVTNLRKKMGLLSQRPQVLPMSIYDNVAYGPRIHGLKDRTKLDNIVEQYLKKSSLWNEVKNRLHAPASKLSIGQQQRLCLARGLAVSPEVILGDEPTSALDPVSAENIEQRFLELKNQYTIILVTHILGQAGKIADYVVFLYLGNLIEHGPADEFFKNPKYAKTEAYLKGQFIEEPKIEKEISLKGVTWPESFDKLKSALDDILSRQALKVVVGNKLEAEKIIKMSELKGHKVLELRQNDKDNWEIIIQKADEAYVI